MALYKKTSVTAKIGINVVRTVVEDAGSLFHKIEQESDIGIDALIELIRDERPLNKQIAVQIKSGQSYYNSGGDECLIPIGSHRDYWTRHPLPVIGIVYVPVLGRAHWLDIKSYLKKFPEATVIRYQTSEANRFDSSTFPRLFVPTMLREVPELSLQEALTLFCSSKPDESYLGLIVLFRRHSNVCKVWDEFIQYFIDRLPESIPSIMIYFLAHIPGHGDIMYFGETVTEETRAYGKKILARFGREEVIKLLRFIDQESFISRGAIGQSVEAIISSLPDNGTILKEIVVDESIDTFLRDRAALILAMNEGAGAVPALRRLVMSGSWYAQELIKHIKEYGGVDPYG